jgi:lipoprotein-anchoring transpeptidase ErfK/SrfK
MSVMIGTAISASPISLGYQTSQASQTQRVNAKSKITSATVIETQQRLVELGYWIARTDGVWDAASRHGLIAFQKVEGRPRTGRLTIAELRALNAASRPSPRETGFAHIEVDLKRQVLFMVDENGTVTKILPVSTGNGKMFEIEGETEPAITPAGRFRIYRKLPGMRKSPLGLLYYPNYILGGIAIHGNGSVPATPASHGCIRIPMFAAKEFSAITPIGLQVIVYDDAKPSASR